MEVGFVGLGNMGTAVALLVAQKGYGVLAWEYHSSVVEEVNSRHLNSRFLPGVALPESLVATSDLGKVVASSQVLFIAIHSPFLKDTLGPVSSYLSENSLVVSLVKGVEEGSLKTPSRILREIFPQARVVVLSGPTVANEFSYGLPAGAVLAGESKEDLHRVAFLVDTEFFRTRFTGDVIGVEWSGVLKNIYAIGLGMMDGAGVRSLNFKAAFLTRALQEMGDLVSALGGRRETVHYLAGLGDLIATALSEHSHNRRLGELLGQGMDLGEVEKEMGVIPEGYRTLKVALYLGEKYHVPIPVARSIWRVITGEVPPKVMVNNFIKLAV